jgi:signal transduction histidine kinase
VRIILFFILTLFAKNSLAYDEYIEQVQQHVAKANTAIEKIKAYDDWLPLAILIHHPDAKKDIDAFKLLAEQEQSALANGIYNLNLAYYMVEYYGDYNKGLEFCIKAKDIFETIQAKPQLVMAYNRLAFLVLWNEIGNKNTIVKENINDKYLSKALAFSKELKNKNLEIITLGYIGSYYNVTENNNQKALTSFFEAEKLLDEQTPPDIKLVILESISIVYADIHDEEKASVYLNKCEALSFFQQFGYGRSNMYRAIAKMYLTNPNEKNFTQALVYANKAYDISLAMNAPEYISQGEQRLFEIYKAMGNEKLALQYHEKYKQHEDSLGRERFQRTYTEYDVVKKEATIKTLEIDKLKNKNNQNTIIAVALFLALLAGVVFGVYFFRNNKKLKLKNEELFQKNEEIGKALIKGQNIERKRVAADLHDSLGVQANSILYNASLLKNDVDDKENRIDFLHETAKEMMLTLRETLWAMKANDIEAVDLWLRIVNFCSQLSRHYKTIHISTKGNPPMHVLVDSPKALNIVMIVQEAVNNAIKHSAANTITVNSNTENSFWQIAITDDGKGFDPTLAVRMDSYGLSNIKERAATSIMNVAIETGLGKGTKIKVDTNIKSQP